VFKKHCFWPSVQKVPITEGQKQCFLNTLRETGVVAWAARIAGRSRSGFDTLKRRDPEFSKLWDDALEEATGLVEHEALRRAVYGTERFEVSGGEVVRHPETGEPIKRVEYSDSLMAMILKARIQSYANKQRIDVTHNYGNAGAVITADQIMKLSEDEQDQLLHLLGRIDEIQKGESTAKLSAEDAEWSEVQDGEELDEDLDAELAKIL
jgi:hypothetical protein